MLGGAAGTKEGLSLVGGKAGKVKLFEGSRRHRGDLSPIAQVGGRDSAVSAEFAVGPVVLKLKREQFEGEF